MSEWLDNQVETLDWLVFSKKLKEKMNQGDKKIVLSRDFHSVRELVGDYFENEGIDIDVDSISDDEVWDVLNEYEQSTYNEVCRFLRNVERRISKNGKVPKAYLVQANTFSPYGSICNNGQCGYKLTDDITEVIPYNMELNEIYFKKEKTGRILHIVCSDHDRTLDLTFKALFFDCFDVDYALERLKIMDEDGVFDNSKFKPTPTPFLKELFYF